MRYSTTQAESPTGNMPEEFSNLEWFLIHGFDTVNGGAAARRRFLTKSQRAYVSLRRSIVTHALPSGVPLDEVLLQDLFPYGRTPLREALKQLSFEGLLVWPSRQAPVIRDIGLNEMRHLYETRQVIEPRVAVLAAERATDTDMVRMNRIREKLVDASLQGLVYESVELDYALHAAIAQATRNRFLAEASDNLNLQSLRLWYRAQGTLGITRIHESHSKLVEAICSHDTTTAHELAIQHIEASRERQRLLLEQDVRPPQALGEPLFFA
jgi:DNA-binding GntR family transcriptional regulator